MGSQMPQQMQAPGGTQSMTSMNPQGQMGPQQGTMANQASQGYAYNQGQY